MRPLGLLLLLVLAACSEEDSPGAGSAGQAGGGQAGAASGGASGQGGAGGDAAGGAGVPASCKFEGAKAQPGGAPCGCRQDCQGDLLCTGGACLPSTCGVTVSCPDKFICQPDASLQPKCQACLGAVAAEGGKCVCGSDCEQGMTCSGGACRRACQADGECLSGEECVIHLIGAGTCAARDAGCQGGGKTEIGALCLCNDDCEGDTKICLDIAVGPMSVGRYCTRRPCDLASSASCSSGKTTTNRCCAQEPLVPPTCFNDQIGGAISAMGTCSP